MSLFQYDPLNDYQLMLDLPSVAKKKIAGIKTAFDMDYKGLAIDGGKPFVYLSVFKQYESLEQKMVDALDSIALGFMPFKMHLKNFGQIDNREIFVTIEDIKSIQLLIDQIKKVSSYLSNAQFNKLPRVSIARNLNAFQLSRSWQRYEEAHFSATFVAIEMLLLKRLEGFTCWQILKRMAFQNMAAVPAFI